MQIDNAYKFERKIFYSDTPQLQVVVIFAENKEKAVEFFYKVHDFGGTITKVLDGLICRESAVKLTEGETEICKSLLSCFTMEKLQEGTHQKYYKYSPERLILVLGKYYSKPAKKFNLGALLNK